MNKQHTLSALRRHYGREPEQYGHLHVSRSDPERGTIVLFHGGFWRRHRDLRMTTPMAHTLAHHGWNVWNVEYRRGEQSAWRQSTADCRQAVEYVTVLAEDLGIDIKPTVLVGHSAGGFLAAWAAGHSTYRTAPHTSVSGLVTLNGVLDLAYAAEVHVGNDAVSDFLGTTPGNCPEMYRAADASARLPHALTARCLHSRQDERVPFSLSENFVESARADGTKAQLVEIRGHHTAPIEPDSDAWTDVLCVIDSFEPRPNARHKTLQEQI